MKKAEKVATSPARFIAWTSTASSQPNVNAQLSDHAEGLSRRAEAFVLMGVNKRHQP